MEPLEQRLEELRAEYERGLQEIARLDQQRQQLQRTLLRISGAIQVLEELLAHPRPETKSPGGPAAVDASEQTDRSDWAEDGIAAVP